MNMTALGDSLSFFGITQSYDEQHQPTWTIELVTDEPETKSRLASFDKQTRKWRLSEPAGNTLQAVSQSAPETPWQMFGSISQPQDTDWTNTLPPSDHTDFFRRLDWATTPLGHCRTWPHSLRLHVQMLVSNSHPAALYWGPKRVVIYNEDLIPVIGEMHPNLMGSSFEEAMPDFWSCFSPQCHDIETGKRGGAWSKLELPLIRHNYLEETWWDGGLVSLKNDEGSYGGIYFFWDETTTTVLRDRRAALVNKLGQPWPVSSSTTWEHIHQVLADFPRDISMAMLYGRDGDGPSDGLLHLKYTLGTTSEYCIAPESLNYTSIDPSNAVASLFGSALKSTKAFELIDLSQDDAHASDFKDVNWLGFEEPSRYLVAAPLRTKESVQGFIVLGLNPRRALDADHEQFVKDVACQFKKLIVKTLSEEDIQKREENLTTELGDIERRITRLAEIVPAGIYELSADGTLCWANSHFYDILGVPHDRREFHLFAWPDYILPDDRSRATAEMTRCLTDAVEISDSLRLTRHYNPPTISQDSQPTDAPFWVMYSASPDIGPDGSVRSLMGSLIDISHLKWAEQLQIRNVELAKRDRQRNEEFIDITSHEMRNPLSAITQCADSIISSLQESYGTNDVHSLIDIIKLNAEAAESILFCASHQRRIIDDVLTLGKLDSELLTISPIGFHPNDLVDQALRMFKTEFEANNIEVQTFADEGSALTSTATAYGDAYRLMQILVNMLTNAIKFTRMQQTREISIRSGSSRSVPSADLFGPGFAWYPTETPRPDLTQESDYGKGEAVYLYYAVVDSGKGIHPDFVSRVFSKFEQADRRTHTKYGGSGLGLYISRELTEMQGGRIGIDSTDEVGSTFAFYTKARRSQNEAVEKNCLPVYISTSANMAQAFQSLKVMGSGTPAYPPVSPNYSILLVEDNILNQRVLAKQLSRVGCVVKVANHGGEAIDYILQMHNLPAEFGTAPVEDLGSYFDCILMDWEMPICDGLCATERIRKIEQQQLSTRNTIIGITANARAEQIAMATKAGMDTVLPKPFRVAELLEKIGDTITCKEPELNHTRIYSS